MGKKQVDKDQFIALCNEEIKKHPSYEQGMEIFGIPQGRSGLDLNGISCCKPDSPKMWGIAAESLVKVSAEYDLSTTNQHDTTFTPEDGISNPLNYPLATRWPRFFARIFDVWMEVGFIYFVLGIFLGAWGLYSVNLVARINEPGVEMVLGILCLPFALILDALMYWGFGNTPGKALLGLKVTTLEGKPPNLVQYLARNFRMWMTGFAFGIPFINLITILWQSHRVGKGQQTSYDESMGHQVRSKPTGRACKIFFVFVFSLFVVRIILEHSVTSYQSYTQRAQFSEVVMAAFDQKIAVETAIQSGMATELSQLNSGALGIPKVIGPSGYVESVVTVGGVITATGTSAVGGATYILTAPNLSVPVQWQEGGSCFGSGLCFGTETISNSIQKDYSWENPLTGLTAKIDSRWKYSTKQNYTEQQIYMFSDQTDHAVVIFGVEQGSRDLTLDDYVRAFQKSTAEKMLFSDGGHFIEKNGQQAWQGSGSMVDITNNRLRVQIIQLGSSFWRIVTIQTMPYEYSDAFVEELRVELFGTLK